MLIKMAIINTPYGLAKESIILFTFSHEGMKTNIDLPVRLLDP